jgi:thymidylate synthase ThyX
MIKAEVILASSTANAKPLYTFKVRYPWFIHGEVMTHRVLSRNASSNRAIPLSKMLQEVRSEPNIRAEPVYWGAEQRGMEPGGELTGRDLELARNDWKIAAICASDMAERMSQHGAHKSLCNRLLMPFTHANVIITATEWDNFFGLRLDKAADPTMRALAEAMWGAMNEAKTQPLKVGEWHLPFVNTNSWEDDELTKIVNATSGGWTQDKHDNIRIKVSVARCARVSYESFETGKRSTVEEDLKLYERLVGSQPLHASPAEHQATPDEYSPSSDVLRGATSGRFNGFYHHPKEHGNFIGWRQYRKMLPGEAVAPLPEGYSK